jgi:hypothetical protein
MLSSPLTPVVSITLAPHIDTPALLHSCTVSILTQVKKKIKMKTLTNDFSAQNLSFGNVVSKPG